MTPPAPQSEQPVPPHVSSNGPSRRGFMKLSALAVAAAAAPATASHHAELDPDRKGVLVDMTLCVGCRRCEWACADANDNPHGELHEYDDASVFDRPRRPTATQLTVVNRTPGQPEPIHLKLQCMHCEKPACVSACLVGAMRKQPDGPVTYDASRCIGCRYCMVACPFEVLGYEYERALTPRVRKCSLCRERTRDGELPACVKICPVEALTYGPRAQLIATARERIAARPDRYIDRIYGEHEAGGTSWLYIAGRPFEELGLPRLGTRSPADSSESVQHGIFRGFAAPLLLGGLLGVIHNVTRHEHEHTHEKGADS
ncbi:MAG: 4Fe-4S dicluster domain-containing protein [Phycisphaerales bacterium]|nr:4Fe-4S dicluster domain-containing protein [Phycisphaerales bacterium]